MRKRRWVEAGVSLRTRIRRSRRGNSTTTGATWALLLRRPESDACFVCRRARHHFDRALCATVTESLLDLRRIVLTDTTDHYEHAAA